MLICKICCTYIAHLLVRRKNGLPANVQTLAAAPFSPTALYDGTWNELAAVSLPLSAIRRPLIADR